jgi:hypothetical protein
MNSSKKGRVYKLYRTIGGQIFDRVSCYYEFIQERRVISYITIGGQLFLLGYCVMNSSKKGRVISYIL